MSNHGIKCCQLGMHVSEPTIERLEDGSYLASVEIEQIFGSEVQGSIEGHGATEAEAIEDLKRAHKEAYDALWV